MEAFIDWIEPGHVFTFVVLASVVGFLLEGIGVYFSMRTYLIVASLAKLRFEDIERDRKEQAERDKILDKTQVESVLPQLKELTESLGVDELKDDHGR